jgi:hypothetical protein
MTQSDSVVQQDDKLRIQETFSSLTEELQQGLSIYWDTATRILDGSGISVVDPPPEYFSTENHLFSALFLYSYFRADLPRPRRILYAAINQCLRGMVTGCDNILDDEYKNTLDTDLPEQATRFRSILDIMVSDRVLFALLHDASLAGSITPDQLMRATFESLRALTRSGAQEASEEGGISSRLRPEDVLSKVHHYKTGILFQCPWAVPEVLEDLSPQTTSRIKTALYQMGMGCQILDDMIDLQRDIAMERHNYVASLIVHEIKSESGAPLHGATDVLDRLDGHFDLSLEFPDAARQAAETALGFLRSGASALFDTEHEFMIDLSIQSITRRIGAERLLSEMLP